MYRHLLAATDGSELANKALMHAAQLAKAMEAQLTILVVTESWPVMEIAQKATERRKDPIGEFEARASAWAAEVLEQAKGMIEATGVRVQTMHVSDMAPAQAIVDSAAKLGCDAIVMSTHGRRGIRRVVLGSQASDVVAEAKVPVIIVK